MNCGEEKNYVIECSYESGTWACNPLEFSKFISSTSTDKIRQLGTVCVPLLLYVCNISCVTIELDWYGNGSCVICYKDIPIPS